MPIVMACMSMAKGRVGALIVIERGAPLDDIVDTGDTIDAVINQRLIENIFFKNSPLHDGAMVISKKPHIKSDVLSRQREILSPLLRYMINPSYATLDYNVPFVRKTVVAGVAAALYLLSERQLLQALPPHFLLPD